MYFDTDFLILLSASFIIETIVLLFVGKKIAGEENITVFKALVIETLKLLTAVFLGFVNIGILLFHLIISFGIAVLLVKYFFETTWGKAAMISIVARAVTSLITGVLTMVAAGI